LDTGGKFAAGVVDTGDKLPPVSLTPAANLQPDISANFRKNYEKIGSKKSRDTVPLRILS
jgi:hypothetical protein